MTEYGSGFESPEVGLWWRYIDSSLGRLVDCLAGLTSEELNWRPPAPGANSLYVLATHTLANAEENLLAVLGGASAARDRGAEFAATSSSADSVTKRWAGLRDELRSALQAILEAQLIQTRPHPRRGTVTGREVLLIVARHAAEHLGQAELTRDLLRARS